MKNLFFLAVASVTIFTGAVAQDHPTPEPPQPSVALPVGLARVLIDYEQAWSKKDASGLAQLFAEDGFVLSPGHAMVRGRMAIEGAYWGFGGPLSLRAVAFAVEGNLAYIIGAYGPTPGPRTTGNSR